MTLSGTKAAMLASTTRKNDAGGQCRHRFYPEGAVLCATCVTVTDGYHRAGSRDGGHGGRAKL
jgi:hypothetical protein